MIRAIDAEQLSEEIKSLRMTITGMNDFKKYASEFKKSILNVIETQPTINPWIPVESGKMPQERKSILSKYYGTEHWNKYMFLTISYDVEVTVEYEDGTRKTTVAHTVDGKWKRQNILGKIIAWREMPEPYVGNMNQE